MFITELDKKDLEKINEYLDGLDNIEKKNLKFILSKKMSAREIENLLYLAKINY